MMGQDASRVDVFANLGVRIIQLTYNNANQLGDGSMAPENRGLTSFGHDVVERLNANRVMVDLSHSGQQICLDAARASKQPISINHTGCRALTDLPRNKTGRGIAAGAAEKGGFVGIYFMPFLSLSGHATAADVVAHIEHAFERLRGEDHVGIGTDGGTTPDRRSGGLQGRALQGSTTTAWPRASPAPGERADTHPFVDDLSRARTSSASSGRLACWRGHKPATDRDAFWGPTTSATGRDIWGCLEPKRAAEDDPEPTSNDLPRGLSATLPSRLRPSATTP